MCEAVRVSNKSQQEMAMGYYTSAFLNRVQPVELILVSLKGE